MGFEIERACWMLQQVAVLHIRHRGAGGGADLQSACSPCRGIELPGLARRQGLHLQEPQLPGPRGRRRRRLGRGRHSLSAGCAAAACNTARASGCSLAACKDAAMDKACVSVCVSA